MASLRKVSVWIAVPLLLTIAAYAIFHEYVRAAALVVRAAGLNGFARTAADWEAGEVSERSSEVPSRHGTLRGRWYTSGNPPHPPLLLVPGVHASGIDEPRLVKFARDIASIGHPVMTVELPDLMRYSITPRSTDMVEDAARWLSEQPTSSPGGRVGLIGISFAGGLSLVAAGRPSVRDRVQFVLSFGGHGDLPRTLRYLCTGVQPDGQHRPPHDYGVAIILLGAADTVVPADQVPGLREAILAFLEGSRLDMIDKPQARTRFEEALAMAEKLPEPSRTLMRYVNARDVEHLGPILLPHLATLGGDPALSPSRSAPPAGTVYLLHGVDDNVIPAVESVLLAAELRTRGVAVEQLATPLVTHAEVDRTPTAGEIYRLVTFWGRLLNE